MSGRHALTSAQQFIEQRLVELPGLLAVDSAETTAREHPQAHAAEFTELGFGVPTTSRMLALAVTCSVRSSTN